jgi:hypothetical protein
LTSDSGGGAGHRRWRCASTRLALSALELASVRDRLHDIDLALDLAFE